VSAIANRFVKDPAEVVKAGDIVKVKVVEVDLVRKRIALTMRLGDDVARKPAAKDARPAGRQPDAKRAQARRDDAPVANNALAAAFAKAVKR
jgi:protein Tex